MTFPEPRCEHMRKAIEDPFEMQSVIVPVYITAEYSSGFPSIAENEAAALNVAKILVSKLCYLSFHPFVKVAIVYIGNEPLFCGGEPDVSCHAQIRLMSRCQGECTMGSIKDPAVTRGQSVDDLIVQHVIAELIRLFVI